MKCAVCGNAEVDADDLCSGCDSFICADHFGSPWGQHGPLDHQWSGEDEDDDRYDCDD